MERIHHLVAAHNKNEPKSKLRYVFLTLFVANCFGLGVAAFSPDSVPKPVLGVIKSVSIFFLALLPAAMFLSFLSNMANSVALYSDDVTPDRYKTCLASFFPAFDLARAGWSVSWWVFVVVLAAFEWHISSVYFAISCLLYQCSRSFCKSRVVDAINKLQGADYDNLVLSLANGNGKILAESTKNEA
jgi:hypothetical protein